MKNQHTALLVMDMQAGILGRFPNADKVVSSVKKAIANARAKEILVIYVTLGFRKGTPEISENNKMFSASREMFANLGTEEFVKIHPELAPHERDITVIKHRVSAFSGSDLEMILRASNIHHVILTGISTSGVVLSTIREASDKDFRITVLSDGCGDREEDVHQLLISRLFPRQADVYTVEEWIKNSESK